MPFSFTVDRSRWLRGETARNSFLQRESDGKRCCLGFLALAAGVPEDAIIGKGGPCTLDLPQHKDQVADLFRTPERYDSLGELMTVNDREDISDTQREAELTTLFQSAEIEVTFVDGLEAS